MVRYVQGNKLYIDNCLVVCINYTLVSGNTHQILKAYADCIENKVLAQLAPRKCAP